MRKFISKQFNVKLFVLIIIGLAFNSNLWAIIMPNEPMTEFAIDGYRGVFDGNNITVKVPKGTDISNKIATFNSSSYLLNGSLKPQISMVTPNNFTTPLLYLFLNKDNVVSSNSPYNYTIRVDNTSSVPSSTMRDNDFELYFGDGVESLSLTYKNSKVSADQRANSGFNTYEIKEDSKKGIKFVHFMFSSGRKKTAPIAESFNDLSGGYMKILGQAYNNLEPAKLNFYITTTLYINNSPVINDVYIAQGSNLYSNNWWVGTKAAIEKYKSCSLKVKTTDDKEYYISTSSSNAFMVSITNGSDNVCNY